MAGMPARAEEEDKRPRTHSRYEGPLSARKHELDNQLADLRNLQAAHLRSVQALERRELAEQTSHQRVLRDQGEELGSVNARLLFEQRTMLTLQARAENLATQNQYLAGKAEAEADAEARVVRTFRREEDDLRRQVRGCKTRSARR